MSGATNCPETPRQKMIAMMYLVLTAMLALNVSADILSGFTMVDRSLTSSVESLKLKNEGLVDDMNFAYSQNPVKVGQWLDKTKEITQKSQEIFDLLQTTKINIIKLADGDEADPTGKTLKNRDNLDVAGTYVGISTDKKRGKELQKAIEDYKEYLISIFKDQRHTDEFNQTFYTGKAENAHGEEADWLNATFESMPVAAVVTMLSKFQVDVLTSQQAAIEFYKAQTDASDFRVNKITAKLIPTSKNVIQGGKFHAEIALMAIDSTKTPDYYIGEEKIDTSVLDIPCSRIGTFPISGRIDLKNKQGQITRYEWSDEYTVSAPTATVANIDMNVVYKGYANKLEISVPGVASSKLSISASGAKMKRQGNYWICSPTSNKDVSIAIFADVEGKKQRMGQSSFRVRTLPDPTAFLRVVDKNKNTVLYRPGHGHKVTRKELMDAKMVAEYADGMLKAKFRIASFTMLVSDGRGGFTPLKSNGSQFSQQQKRALVKLKSGTIITFDNIKCVGAKTTTLSFSPIKLP